MLHLLYTIPSKVLVLREFEKDDRFCCCCAAVA